MSIENCREINNFKTVCRVCLIQYPEMHHKDLSLPINDQDDGEDSLLIFEALKDIIGEKIVNIDGYPSSICDTCLAALGTAYDLKRQYFNSKNILETVLASQHHHDTFYENSKSTDSLNVKSPKKELKRFANVQVQKEQTLKNKRFYVIKQQPIIELISRGVQTRPVKIDTQEDSPNVELLLGPKSYDIKDLVIVEDPLKLEKDDDDSYEHFLQNLGSVVSASFARKKGTAKQQINSTKRRPKKRTEIEITPLSEDIDVGSLEPLEALASKPSKMSYGCRHCKETFFSATYVKEHVPICEKFKKLQCYVCDVKKSCLKDLIAHVKRQHHDKHLPLVKKRRMKTGKTSLKCNICDKVFASRPSLRYHMLHHKDRQFACDECGKTFFTIHVLNGHKINAHQNETVEVCPVCAKTFTYRNGLSSHMKLHSDELRYQCSLCGKRFRFLGSKTSHELSHTGAKPYGCRFCEIHFTRHSSRKKHERTVHTGERPFKCQFCNTACVTKDYLKRHMMAHTGSFECSICNKGLVDAEILRLHLRMKHNIKDQNQEESLIEGTAQENEENEFDEHIISDQTHEEILTEETAQEIEENYFEDHQYHIPDILYDE